VRKFIIGGLILITILTLYVSSGMADKSNDTATEISITNEIIPINEEKKFQMIYTITTPKIVHYNFVLALDSSGSFKETSTQTKAVLRDIPKFLNNLPKLYPDAIFNISLVGWDDNIDFAYDKKLGFISLNDNEPRSHKLASLENATNDIKKLPVFFKCNQTENTDFSVPIKASLDIFRNPENRPKDPLHTRQFIVLVTGNGEYKPASSDLLNEARDNKIDIYTVGLDIPDESELHEYLTDISNNENKIRYAVSYVNVLNKALSDFVEVDTDLYSELNATIEKALRTHFDNIMNKSVADNVEIIDRFYCYNKPDINSLRVDTNKESQSLQSIIEPNPLPDGTTEVLVKISALLPNSTTTVAFNIENTFNPMTLPVTVSERKGPLVICSPSEREGPMLRYTWHSNMQEKELPLGTASRGRLSIMSVNNTNLNKTLKTKNIGFIDMLNFFFRMG